MSWNRPATPEGAVKNAIRQYLRHNAWFVFHVQGGPLSYPGVSDLIAVKCGVVLFLEIKAPAGKTRTGKSRSQGMPSPAQRKFGDDILSRGGHYHIVSSLDEVQRIEREFMAAVKTGGDQHADKNKLRSNL
jgi:hypothetical protein